MIKEPSALIEGCSASQLKALLALGAADTGQPLPVQGMPYDEFQQLLSDQCQYLAESGPQLLCQVCAENTPIETLRNIKDLAKYLIAGAKTDAQRTAVTILYHAAIAAAYGSHGINLSSRSIEARLELYLDLADASRDNPLGQVFDSAVDRAEKK